jgi:hypothetical protein
MTNAKIDVINISERKYRAGEGRKHNAAQREHIRAEIAKLRYRGISFRDIADELHISLAYCYSEYKKLEEAWIAESLHDVARLRAREIAKLDEIEAQAWQAWSRSCDYHTILAEQFEYGPTGDRRRKKAEAKRIERPGDAKFLDIIGKCIERRCKLLGLDRLAADASPAADEQNALSVRLAQYQGVLGVVAVGLTNPLALDDSAGESVDSARSASETSAILDVDGYVRETTA